MNKKKVIFGAGMYGALALEQEAENDVDYFLDNSIEKQHMLFKGKKVISVEEFLPLKEKYHVIISSLYSDNMEKQLLELGIVDYSFFLKEYRRFYETNELIFNPYELEAEVHSEEEWSSSKRIEFARKAVFDAVEDIYEKKELFNHVEVETINRCNGTCSFCPVNCKIDPREKKIMSEELFKKIVDDLEKIKYSGRFTTFSNNEPLLDSRIIELNRYARKHLPNAKMHLFTNGTLLTIEKFIVLVEILDELIIDNYQQDLKLIKSCIPIVEYCERYPELKKKVTIVLRKPQEILTSRGGDAPNRSNVVLYEKDRCLLPFKQIIIRPDGKISLCCNDAVGKYTLGDVSKNNLVDIWYNSKFAMVRKCLYEGRENWGNCKFCDTFSMG